MWNVQEPHGVLGGLPEHAELCSCHLHFRRRVWGSSEYSWRYRCVGDIFHTRRKVDLDAFRLPDHIGAGALVAHMDKDVEPLRCHWNDGHIPAPLPLLGRAELAGMGITRGRCEIVNECQDSFTKGGVINTCRKRDWGPLRGKLKLLVKQFFWSFWAFSIRLDTKLPVHVTFDPKKSISTRKLLLEISTCDAKKCLVYLPFLTPNLKFEFQNQDVPDLEGLIIQKKVIVLPNYSKCKCLSFPRKGPQSLFWTYLWRRL